MSYNITQINAAPSADTFQIWVDRTNEVINAISTIVVTTNTHANGGLTTGNGWVEGIFGALNLRANTISGGTVQTPGVLTLTSNLAITGGNVTFGTVVVNTTMITIGGSNVALITDAGVNTTTSGTTAQQVDFWDKTAYRAAEYTLTIKDNDANNHQVSRFLVLHDEGDAYYTQYAIVWSNNAQGNFSANANSTHVRVYLTPVSSNTNVKGDRKWIRV